MVSILNEVVKEKKSTPLGRLLVDKGLISEHDLWHAMVAQGVSGEKLGRILLGQGSINSYRLHQVIAEQYGVDFVDLNITPPDWPLLKPEERNNYLKFFAIPWKEEAGKVHIAVSDITRELLEWAERSYKGAYVLGITSPFDIYWTVQNYFAHDDDEEARNLLWLMDHQRSARKLIIRPRWSDLAAMAFLAGLAAYFPGEALKVFFMLINCFYLLTLIFKVAIFTLGLMSHKELIREVDVSRLNEKELPVYTILIPLFKENGKVIKKLLDNIRALDYPKAKLDVKLITEANDYQTIDLIKSLQPENIFEIVRVPYSIPQTKPKALNYALRFARGEYVTIYDAEDHPEPKQLKRVITKFKSAAPDVVCLQARLNYYNYNENILTKMFAIEYASWFDYMLNGLSRLGVPIPLGGTSNHLPIAVLRKLYAWDPYNVTEDADLGVRLAEFGYRTQIVESITLEEAPIGILGWMRQRARWIKGYMQTYIVHMRNPVTLYRALGFKGFIGFQFFIGAPSVVFLTIPLMVLMSGAIYAEYIDLNQELLYFAIGNLGVGTLIHIAISVIVVAKNRWWNMLFYSALFPFYWLLHSVSSFRSLYELIRRPHYWNKTEHGLSKITDV